MVLKVLLSSFYISISGLFLAEVLGLRLMGQLVAAMGVLLLVLGAFGAGIFISIHEMEHTKLMHIADGKEEVRIGLCLGPFKYERVVPERKIGKKE